MRKQFIFSAMLGLCAFGGTAVYAAPDMVAVAQSQTIKVKGQVIDELGEPLLGATILIKDGKGGTTTDLDGNFQLDVPGDAVLVISYVGYKNREVAVRNRAILEPIQMEPDNQLLEQVVVVGYGTQKKADLTGSVAVVDAEALKRTSNSNISTMLEGKVAGVQITSDGQPGADPTVRIRGIGSFGSTAPLYVIDGVPMGTSIRDFSSNDIATIQVLKDASAAAIYGSRAANGVVIITTKQGKKDQPLKVDYNGYFGVDYIPSGVYDVMDANQYSQYLGQAAANSNTPLPGGYHFDEATGQYRFMDDTNTDWFDELFSNAVMQNHSVSIAGGTEKGNFYTSLSFMNDPGWYISSNVRRYTFNANASYQISPTVRFSVLTSDSYRKQKAPGTLSQETDPVSGEVKRSFDINPYSYALNTSRTLDPHETYKRNWSDFNIFDELENNYMDIGVTDLKFQAELNWKPIEGLELNALGAYRYQSSVQEHHVMDHSNQANAYRAGVDPEDATIRDINPYLYTDPDNPNALPVSILPKGGIYYNDTYTVSQYDFRGTATYNKVWNNEHIFNALVGLEVNNTERTALNYTGWGFVYDNGGIPFVDYNWLKQLNEENGSYYGRELTYKRSFASFGNLTYSYAGRYVINGTIRYEGTNKLGKSRSARWLPTWNVSGAWNAHEENWFRDNAALNKVLSHATLRLSYSLTADSGPDWVSNATVVYNPYRPWRPISGVQELGLQLTDLANTELTYEKKREFNVGVDLGFMPGSRINVSADVYVRDNYDLIGEIYTQGVGGVTMKYANVASMKSHGAEVTISTRNIDTKDFSWTTDLTFAKTKNEITELDARSNVMQLVSGSGYALQGYPVRAIFSIPFVGLNEEGLPQFINEDGEVTVTDINFQEFEKTDYLKYEGPTDPTITGGFGNIFTWKNFRLNVFMTYSFGNKIRLDPVFASSYDDLTAMPKEFKNRWTLPGDEKYTTIPVIASKRQSENYLYLDRAYSAYNYSTERIADGGFIRLKEVSLTYDLPKSFLEKIRFSSASLKLQATNLWLIYSDKKLNGQDPEFFNSGGVASPNPKQFTFTLRFSL